MKQLHTQITEATSKFDECTRTLNDFDAAKKKLAVENAELLRQLEEAENQTTMLTKVKSTLYNQLEESKKVSEEESKVNFIILYFNYNSCILKNLYHMF